MIFLLFLFGFVVLARIAEYLGYYIDGEMRLPELIFSLSIYILIFGCVIVAMFNI